MAKELFEFVQTALEVRFFKAGHGEKGKREEEMGNMLRKAGIQGSNAVFKARLMEVLGWHQEPLTAPKAIIDAIEGSSWEISFGAPKADEDKQGGEAIRQASLRMSHERKSATVEILSPHGLCGSPPSKPSDHPHSSSSDMDSDTDKEKKPKPATSAKRFHCNEDSTSLTQHVSKRMRHSASSMVLNAVESMFEEERKHHKKGEAHILAQMELSNKQYAEARRDTKEFQNNLLDIFHQIANK
ncbi:hypothetical protein C0992_003435 [Termitomyces sp. T32_za158]|nr:hypothetical protein C0992_003435 [Termitomyces sp. T32_za158]